MDLLTRREAAFFMEERNALVFAQSSPWITTLYSAFQDDEHLYLLMEYASGGSLRSLMNNRETVMEELEAKFYVGEILIALEELHKLNFIHRDVKPENCLIDSTGHIKLADFGSCMRLGDEKRITSGETVGTPDYICPEILRAQEGNVSYGHGCDWWSLGIILYELLFDEVPFYSESLAETYGKIMEHEKHFAYPDEHTASETVLDLMSKLICKQEIRIGSKGAEEIKDHPFFQAFDWAGIRNTKAPFIPELSGPDDTRYFEDEENESKKMAQKAIKKTKDYSGQNLPFIGYTYVQNAKPIVSLDISDSKNNKNVIMSNAQTSVDHGRLMELDREIAELKTALKKAEEKDKNSSLVQTEIELLKNKLERESNTKKKLSEKLEDLEREKNSFDNEIKQMKFDRDHERHEREELEDKLTQLKKTLDKEIKANLELQETQDSYQTLVKQITKLRTEIEDEKESSKKFSFNFSELSKAKALLELELEQLKRKQKEDESYNKETKQKISDLESKLEVAKKKLVESENEISLIMKRESDLQEKFSQLNITLVDFKNKLEQSYQVASNAEKEKAVISVELNAALKKMKELQDSFNKLSENEEKHQRSESGANESIQALKKELETLTKLKQENAEEFGQVSKCKALLELEVTELKVKLEKAEAYSKVMSSKLDFSEKRVEELNAENRSQVQINFQSSRYKKDKDNELIEIQQKLAEAFKALSEANNKASTLEKENTVLSNDIMEYTSKFEKQQANVFESENKIKDLECRIVDERKARYLIESTLKTADTEKVELGLELKRLQLRIATLKEEQTKFLQVQLEADEKTKTIGNLKSTIEKLETDLTKSQKQNLLDAKTQSICDVLKTLNADSHQQIGELNAKLQDEESRNSQLSSKVLEMEQVILQLKGNADQNMKKMAKSMDNLKAESPTGKLQSLNNLKSSDSASVNQLSPSRRGLNASKIKSVLFFKGSHQKEERDRAMQQIKDLEEEIKKTAQYSNDQLPDHERKASSISNVTASSIKTRQSEAFSFDTSEGLKGWLKIPKQGKVKKGWKRVYAVVRDYKLYTYEKEKDAEENPISKALDVIDLRSDAFYAKKVTQAELIHASSKDIDSVFKLHFSTVKRSRKESREMDHSRSESPSSGSIKEGGDTKRKSTMKKLKRLSANMLSIDTPATPTTPSPLSYNLSSLSKIDTPTQNNILNNNSNNIQDSITGKRITNLQALIALEEKYLIGAQNLLLAATAESQRLMTVQQIELFQKNIKDWKLELDKMVQELNSSSSQTGEAIVLSPGSEQGVINMVFEQDCLDWKKELEELLKKKKQEKEGILKISKSQNYGLVTLNNTSNTNSTSNLGAINNQKSPVKFTGASSKDVEGALLLVDKDISKIVEDLEILKSGNKETISKLLKSLNEHIALSACNGHYFKKRTLNKPTECGQCKEALYLASEGVKTVMECEVCHALCHNYCKLNFDISCQDYTKLKNIQPVYFMALDVADRQRWIMGIEFYLKELDKFNQYSSVPGTPLTGNLSPFKDLKSAGSLNSIGEQGLPSMQLAPPVFGSQPLSAIPDIIEMSEKNSLPKTGSLHSINSTSSNASFLVTDKKQHRVQREGGK
ncbi:Serine/threonine-protein kinase MRCK alpha [Clydaea vesicula]|uniref:non-specific serine/threonine protein kinase n=1 Tax=Clydaea vesicula TaxID=447962 RepID=A0AAD5U7E6_9FUNG|nr:Serine/threonine-protein kinase MRCK alpha [Clydaea vesicula]